MRKSLSRSAFLVKKNWWRVLGILIVLGLIGSILSAVAGGVIGFVIGLIGVAVGASEVLIGQVAELAGSLVGIFFAPIGLIGVTLLYFDLRVRKEGYNLEVMAQELRVADKLG